MASRSGLLLFLSAIICLLPVQLSNCQDLQCSTLNTGYNGEPIAGSDLGICSTPDLQCCQQNYIDSVETLASNKLTDELRAQLRNTAATFNSTVARIHSYFNNEFVTGFLQIISDAIEIANVNIDLVFLRRLVGENVNMISTNIVIDDNTRNFNVTEVITNIIMSVGNELATRLGTQSRANFTCLLNIIRNSINETDVAEVVRSIEELRRSFTLLNRVVDYLRDFSDTTQFQLPQNCVHRFVELNFCARCRGQTPPLCSNTCGALVRGCLSAHYAALTQQFDILWNVSRQVLNATNNTLHTLFTEERLLVDVTTATAQVFQCTSASGRRKRQTGGGEGTTPPFIPAERMQELARLAGRAFYYDDGSDNQGPVICRPSGDERSFCGNSGASARSQNCTSNDPCTSSCRCYNGQSEQRTNTQEFDIDGIDGQGNNPAINLDIDELEEIARSIGTPASAFLQQAEVASLIPDSVEIPPGEPYSTGSDRMSSQTMVSLMVTAAAMAVFVKA